MSSGSREVAKLAKERPVLFSAPMIVALLRALDPKTQTRRIVTPQPPTDFDFVACPGGDFWWSNGDDDNPQSHHIRCPYGQPGDRLWVKETWKTRREWDGRKPTDIPLDEGEQADLDYARQQHITYATADDGAVKLTGKTRPCLFMRRWMSRITLEITAVRVERLQDITEEDAKAEGIFQFGDLGFYGYDKQGTPGPHCCDTARDTYQALWESINGKGSWAENPWVWVLEFKKL